MVLESDSSTWDLCQEVAQSLGLQSQSKRNGDTLAAQFEMGQADIVLVGDGALGASGVELLREMKADYPETEVVVLSEDARVSSAVEAIKLGAYEYLPKPVDPGRLKNVLEKLVRRLEQSSEDRLLQEKLRTQHGLVKLVGTSLKMRRTYRMILKLASRRHPVMIVGESGTGKELVARAIHDFGPFRERPFVPVDCSALAPTLIESELFGHVRGAFTGAHVSRLGRREGERYCLMRSPSSPWVYRPSCCGRCRSGNSNRSAAITYGPSRRGLSPPATEILKRRSPGMSSARTFTSV